MGAAPALRSALAAAARAQAGTSVRVGLTAKQKRLFDFVRAEIEAGRTPPSYDEMAAFMGLLSKASVARLVDGIVERGHLVRLRHRARALALPGAAAAPTPAARPRRVAIKRGTVDRLVAYADRKGLPPGDVLAAALDAHMRRHP